MELWLYIDGRSYDNGPVLVSIITRLASHYVSKMGVYLLYGDCQSLVISVVFAVQFRSPLESLTGISGRQLNVVSFLLFLSRNPIFTQSSWTFFSESESSIST